MQSPHRRVGQTTPPTDDNADPIPERPRPQAPTTAGEEIIITGSLLPRTSRETPSPVTVLSAETLAQRGINTVSEAVQRISANNAGTIQAGWNTGFNFASGAKAPSLRGLTVQDTVSLFDGLRMAVYPLADDGQRNFVDLNTIPNAIIDRIEILRDGASSTYGADAIAGVVNIITKKEIQGLHANVSYGISQRGDGKEPHVDLTYGFGDLASQGFNIYVSGEYQKTGAIFAKDRALPVQHPGLEQHLQRFRSAGWLHVEPELERHQRERFVQRPHLDPGRLPRASRHCGNAAGAGRFSFLNPAAGCLDFDTVHPVSQPATASTPLVNGVLTSCEVNFQSDTT